uniref:Interleukin-12 subunit beta n=1 Tax=Scleropages formosus TaxID=113540 RepID=A0A8C9S9A2_SCLFO
MGGCVGSHHDSSGSLNENSDGTGVALGRNQPLKRDKPKWKSDYPMTDGQLRSKRDEFWDTAPAFEGRKEIWDALRAAAHAFESNDHELAQAIIDGASITLPHGYINSQALRHPLRNELEVPETLSIMIFVILNILLLIIQPGKGNESQPPNYSILQPNVLAVEVNLAESNPMVNVSLRCEETDNPREVSWQYNGAPMDQHGNDITVTVEELFGGNYTCYDSEGAFLNYTLVLVRSSGHKILMGSGDTGYIACTSQNYNGSFQCSWSWSPDRNGEVMFVTATRWSKGSEISCALGSSQQSISCQDQTYCPYAEEVDRIVIELGVRHKYRLEKYSVSFYINEIVKPDKLEITKIDQSKIEWEYPRTWSVPDSYFPLTFEVKELPHKKDCTCESKCRRNKPVKVNTTQDRQWTVKKGFIICVRAQDALCNSSWSDWSQYIENYP